MRCLLLFSFSIFSSDPTLCSDAGEFSHRDDFNNREKQKKPKQKTYKKIKHINSLPFLAKRGGMRCSWRSGGEWVLPSQIQCLPPPTLLLQILQTPAHLSPPPGKANRVHQ